MQHTKTRATSSSPGGRIVDNTPDRRIEVRRTGKPRRIYVGEYGPTAGLSSTSPRQWRKIVARHRREARPEIAARIAQADREGVRVDDKGVPIRSWRDGGATLQHQERMWRRTHEKRQRGSAPKAPTAQRTTAERLALAAAIRQARPKMTAREALAQAFSARPKARDRRRT